MLFVITEQKIANSNTENVLRDQNKIDLMKIIKGGLRGSPLVSYLKISKVMISREKF